MTTALSPLDSPLNTSSAAPLPLDAEERAVVYLRWPTPQQQTAFLAAVILTLVALSLAGQVSKHVFGHGSLKGLVPLFYLDEEASVPTWYSSVALLYASLLLAALAASTRRLPGRDCRCWSALSVLFLLLSLDEIGMIHELPIDPLREAWNAGGVLYYAWVVPGALFVGLLGLLFQGFVRSLPARIRNLLLLSAGVFVAGAIGVEMVSGWWADQYGEQNLTYAVIISAEEFCEMAGVVLFLRGLGEQCAHTVRGFVLRIPALAGTEQGPHV